MSNQLISVFVIDDDKAFLKLLEDVIETIASEFNICISLDMYTELLPIINYEKYNLFFLDIIMPGLNGFILSKQIMSTVNAKVVFVTANNDFVFESFGFGAYDFIRKSNLQKDLRRVLNRYIDEYMSNVIFSIHGFRKELPTNKIVMISVEGNYLEIQTEERNYRIRMTMKDFVMNNRVFDNNHFIQINQSEIGSVK